MKKMESQGPGKYDANEKLTRATSPSAFISKASRLSQNRSDAPGAGQYNPQLPSSSPSFKIGEKRDLKDRSLSPGPGAYTANDSPVRARPQTAYIAGSQRMDLANRSGNPGPGNYDSPSRASGPHYTIGEKRQQKLAAQTPGVGTYEPSDKIVKSKS